MASPFPLPARLFLAPLLAAGLTVGGCVTVRPPGPNPDGLADEALSLRYLLDQGCLPYVQGRITEDVVIRRKGLLRGNPSIGVGRTSCTVVMNGGPVADYRRALNVVLDRRLGPANEPDVADIPTLPDRLTGCRAGVRYASYEERGRFHVELNRSGCGGARPQAPIARSPNAPEQTIAVADLMGRTANEVRERIRARAPDKDYVAEVRLSDGVSIQTRDGVDMTRAGGLCALDSNLSFQSATEPWRPIFPRFVFRDGRLTDIQLTSGGGSLDRSQSLDVLCRPRQGDPISDAVGIMIYAPWIAAVAAGRVPETVDRVGARGELAKLRLGEPPPGGLEAYAVKPPKDVQVQVSGPGQGLITVDLGRGPITNAPSLVRAEVAEGRIVAITKADNFVPCWIERDRSVRCGATAAPL